MMFRRCIFPVLIANAKTTSPATTRSFRSCNSLYSNSWDATTVPINIFKNGKDPVVRKNSEYPDWLWSMNEDPDSYDELKMIVADAKGDAHVLSESQLKRFEQLHRRYAVKEANKRTKK